MSRHGAEAAAGPVSGVIQTHAKDPLNRPDPARRNRGRGRPDAEAAQGTYLGRTSSPLGGENADTGGGRVSIAAVACYRLGTGFTRTSSCGCTAAAMASRRDSPWADDRNLIIVTHRALSALVV
jgi:hypothetical protein